MVHLLSVSKCCRHTDKNTQLREPVDKTGDERIRIAGLESSEESPHVANKRPSQITRRQRESPITQLSFKAPPIYALQQALQCHKTTKNSHYQHADEAPVFHYEISWSKICELAMSFFF